MKKWLLCVLWVHLLYAEFTDLLSQQIGTEEKNWLFSPFSIQTALSMVAVGARGKTREEFEALLPPLKLFKDPQLKIVQGLWVKEDFALLPTFTEELKQTFGVSAERVIFSPETVQKINSWISRKTEQKICNLLPLDALNERTRLVLASALYFRGSWRSPFPAKQTALRPFYPSLFSTLHVETMQQEGIFPYYENEELQAVQLSFSENEALSCLLILPKSGVFHFEQLPSIIEGLQERALLLQVPKFQVEHSMELSSPLQAIGLSTLFSQAADLSRIDGRGALYVSSVFHKTFFSFVENGVEAAAATSSVLNLTSMHLPPPTPFTPLILDRPFTFLLLHKSSKTPLFFGHLQNPSK